MGVGTGVGVGTGAGAGPGSGTTAGGGRSGGAVGLGVGVGLVLGRGVGLGELVGGVELGFAGGVFPVRPVLKGSQSTPAPAKGSHLGAWPPESQTRVPGPRPRMKKPIVSATSSARTEEATRLALIRTVLSGYVA